MSQQRLSWSFAFWLGCFAVLMMHLGPLVSGVQGVWAVQEKTSFVQPLHAGHESADSGHEAHHVLMGHRPNPFLPEWVNNLKMCGYCELLTLSPALLLALVFALALLAARPLSIVWVVADVYASCLRPHAAPRAPPAFA